MKKFNEQITAHMSLFGRILECESYGDYGNGQVTLKATDGGADTVVHYETARDPGQVRFLGSTFKPSAKAGKYDVDRVAGLLLREEAETKASRARVLETRRLLEDKERRRDVANRVTHKVGRRDMEVLVHYDETDTRYIVRIKVDRQPTLQEDEALLGAIMDCIQENGFVPSKPTSAE